MSMSVYVYGLADAEKRQKAKEARDTLNILGLEYPSKLDDIIEDSIDLKHKNFVEGSQDIYEIDVKDIPDNATKIRFVIDY